MSLIGDKYHLLEWPLGKEWIDKLLGRIVLDKETPTQQTAPPADEAEEGPKGSWIPQQIVKNLSDAPVPYPTLHYLLSDFKDIGQKAKITEFFHEKASQKTATETKIVAIEVERYDISNVQFKLDLLMKNEDYAREAKAILSPPDGNLRSLGLVTGILVSRSITVTEEDTKTTSISAAAKVPVGKLASIPTDSLDVEFGANRDRTKEKRTERKIEALSVFGVAYTNVELDPINPPSDRKKSSFFRRSKHKKNPGVEYKVVIDTRNGARNFMGSDSSVSTQTSEGGARSETSTHVEDKVREGEEGMSFTTPDTVF